MGLAASDASNAARFAAERDDVIARLATGGDRSAYDYLLKGVHSFPDQPTFAAELSACGYEAVTWRNLTFGIVALHEGRKPG